LFLHFCSAEHYSCQ